MAVSPAQSADGAPASDTVKTEVLERYGIPGEVIKRWQHDGIRQLLPVQIQSVTRYGLLDGDSLVISGPGTSGKTFCGEMAALKSASARGKSVFLVPLKAIALEKYKTFKSRYSPLGLDIKMISRDHTDHEKEITKGKYDILISIYEKFNSLTSSDISLIKNCGCFILDEFQMISDPERGIELELIISKIRKLNPSAQLVILLGGGFKADIISNWLNLPVLEETRRPVDLRMGVLFRGTFHFRGFNNHDEGDECWLERRESDEDSPIDSQAIAAVRHLAEEGEQTIIFASTKRGAVALALYLARELKLEAARNQIGSLDDLPPSIQNEVLGQCLYGGTAFHHAELDQDHRGLVESGFKQGKIRILVSTTTLAWGVNLPAKNVFIEAMKYAGSKEPNCRNMMIPLTSVDFTQAAGRAGRIGYTGGFGRAILTAGSPFENEVLWENYVYGRPPAVPSGFYEIRLPELLIRLISCGIVRCIRELREIMAGTFWSHCIDRGESVLENVLSTLDYLEKGGLINIDTGDRLSVTPLGSVVSSSGFSAESIIKIYEKAKENTLSGAFEWLYFSLGLPEWQYNSGNYSLRNISAVDLFQRINLLAGGEIEKSEYLSAKLSLGDDKSIYRCICESLFVMEWISGKPVRELESCFNRGSGGLRQDALTLCWIIKTISRVLVIDSDSEEEYHNLRRELMKLAARLRYGLPEDKIPLAKALDIDREFINRLFTVGITGPRDFQEAEYSLLKDIIPRRVLSRALDKMKNFKDDSTKTESDFSIGQDDGSPFTGERRRLRRELKIGGNSIFLQPKLYSYFRKLWWGHKSGNPWVQKDSLEPGINQAKYISKLRRELEDNRIDVKIVSDGAGSYRLVLPESEDSPVIAGRY